MRRFFVFLFIAEMIVAGLAPVIFINITDRLIAGIVAGAFFVALGVFIVTLGVAAPLFRKTATFWMGCVHLFGSALPLLMTRFLNFSKGFEDISVLCLPGPVFHRVSTIIYFILMAATVYDLVKAGRATHE